MEIKHNAEELKQMQFLPLEMKIRMTKKRVCNFYGYFNGDVYVSFSGGKDSTVLKHIIDSIYDDVPAVFVNTGLEYPEIQRFVRDVKSGKYDCFNTDVEIIKPEMRFDEVIEKYGYPVISKEIAEAVEDAKRNIPKGKITERIKKLNGFYAKSRRDGRVSRYDFSKYNYLIDSQFKISAKCCDVIKKKPAKNYEKQSGRHAVVGIMANESQIRKTQWYKTGCNSFESKRPMSKPLSFWTDQDILEYIVKYNVPYASVYGDIFESGKTIERFDGTHNCLKTSKCERTGCMFCMFGCHLEKEPNRFQRMKETHPKQYDYCMNKLALKEVLDFIDVPYE